jgi:hypothetical protein
MFTAAYTPILQFAQTTPAALSILTSKAPLQAAKWTPPTTLDFAETIISKAANSNALTKQHMFAHQQVRLASPKNTQRLLL